MTEPSDTLPRLAQLLNAQEGKPMLATWRSEPGVLGVRLTFHRDGNRPHLTDGTMDWFWPEAERLGIPAMVHAPERLPEIGKLAERHPGLSFIIDHLGFARATIDAATGPAVERLIALARFPNVTTRPRFIRGRIRPPQFRSPLPPSPDSRTGRSSLPYASCPHPA